MRRPLIRVLPRLLAAFAFIWAGFYIGRSYLGIGLVSLGVGAVSIVLVWRIWLAERTATIEMDGDRNAPEFDYLVWVSLGVPMIFAILIVILVITSR